MRLRPARGDAEAAPNSPDWEEWLLVEWPGGGTEPTGYWLSNLPLSTPVRMLVQAAKGRWRTRWDLQDLRQGAGLEHYEGRGWRGFHHHATLCIAAYGFLISERETISPSGDRATTLYPQFALREGHQPRGSAVAA